MDWAGFGVEQFHKAVSEKSSDKKAIDFSSEDEETLGNYPDKNEMDDNEVKETESKENEESIKDDSNKIVTRSHNKKKQHDLNVNSFYVENLQHEVTDALMENVMVVEIPVKEHGRPECIEAKEAEIQNLLNFDTFDEVDDVGQKTIQSRWILTEKQAHDRQKKKVRERLVGKNQ